MIFKKLKTKTYDAYLKYWECPINENLILLEAGQGKNVNGNMFALLREICTNSRWQTLKPVFVVTQGTLEAARERMEFYHLNPELVIRNSTRYCEVLATARYLATDNSFPPFFLKREGQIYLNTWHGTPLKTLGKSDLKNAASMANLQKNYLMSDYALFPNEFTRDVFMKDYLLENLYTGKILLCDYPRNSIFLNQEYSEHLRAELGLRGKQVIAYMPTWRGANRKAEIGRQKQILEDYFRQIDEKLRDDQIFYVNLHFLVGNTMEFDAYRHIRPFPAEYETYDVLSVCDALVTDYSSVFFDFAITGRKIVLFPYDYQEYMENRGTYFPMEELPFPITYQVEELIDAINDREKSRDRQQFLKTYCSYCDREIPGRVMELLVEGKTDSLQLQTPPGNGKKQVLLYAGKMDNVFFNRSVLEEVEKQEKNTDNQVILAFTGNFTPKIVETLEQLPASVSFLNLVSEYNFPRMHRALLPLLQRNSLFHRFVGNRWKADFQRECKRIYSGIQPAVTINYSGLPNAMYRILAEMPGRKEAHIHHDCIRGLAGKSRSSRWMEKCLPDLYDQVRDHRQEDVSRYWEDRQESYYNKCCRIDNLLIRFKNKKDSISVSGIASVRTTLPFSLEGLKFQVGEMTYPGSFRKGLRLGRRKRITRYRLEIPCEDLSKMQTSNKVFAVYQDQEGRGLQISIGYLKRRWDKRKWKKGPIRIIRESNTSAYFRQSVKNRLYLAVRSTNRTDHPAEQRKLCAAYYAARLLPKKNGIFLFEKNGERYEESASVLYENLLDQGYRQVSFVLDTEYPFYQQIPEKYRKNLLDKCSFRHYLEFFRAKTFIGTETLVHAVDLRIDNKYAREKLAEKDLNVVFLQHGVMYMVSLDSESRTFFRQRNTKGKYRVVVSSREEARHFVELGHYDPETLYITGLPKYDRNRRMEDADKIVIMPTWRPWEYNEVRFDFAHTGYYRMLERMFQAVPEEMKERVILLPHPLFYGAVSEKEFPLKQYMDVTTKYDDILKHARILVTDYSSIAYDAFYRGANVIFYWEEKDACMEKYGPSTKLMLHENNTFGDICYQEKDLQEALRNNDRMEQKEQYLDHYRKLVEFHDGRNTQRLMECLERDQLL